MGETPGYNPDVETPVEPEPSPESIKELFDQLVGEMEKEEGKYQDRRKLEDDKGIYLWEITIPGEDGDTEYMYRRKGDHKEGQTSETSVYVTFFDSDGMPEDGYLVAKFVNGEWERKD